MFFRTKTIFYEQEIYFVFFSIYIFKHLCEYNVSFLPCARARDYSAEWARLGQGGHLLAIFLLPYLQISFIRQTPDPVGVHMYILRLCMCVSVSIGTDITYGAASSTTANPHRHQKWKMLASPNLSFLHLLYVVRVNVTSPT